MRFAIAFSLAAIVHAFSVSVALAQTVPNSFRAIIFDEQAELPPAILSQYRDLFEDFKAAGLEGPKFMIATHKQNSEGQPTFTEAFVRVRSALTCAASGQCEIDFFFVDDNNKKATRLLSVVAENIGMSIERQAQPNGRSSPVLITNFPLTEAAIGSLKGNPEPVKYTGGTIWTWDSKINKFRPEK